MNEDDRILLAAFVAVESAHAFSAFEPSFFTIRTFADSAEKVRPLREGYVPSVLFAVILGAVVSALADTWWPLVGAIATSAFMVMMYEKAIEGSPAWDRSSSSSLASCSSCR